ncbi:vacuolar trafficking protein [Coccomyxa subellipsoidea C-169]|uniref:Vacuolar trafficking protein n=1 Tax=Coccomyxa subellipsoidea (strain C-169) TaxID=574566 RepID=I0Z9I7_COCSC|nr:vacuolar trafficking protein [Coccomyxa subellipsoidea C-169]EIE27306.1 vacuolar trafficking protein [Coccomyxa subellipsoidea C-169]|eukprot:XP_005651850.1 vacuolar trafficking protein [Coccomyxa subellipsoidea C-169]
MRWSVWQGCALWHNWWPLLTAFMYVLVPMPYLFFGASSESSSAYGDSSLASGWIDAGKFLTGFSAVGSVAIPAILFHAEKITGGALATELAAVLVLAGTAFAFDYLSNEDASYY